MPAWAAWIVGILLSAMIGAVSGFGAAKEAARSEIANECRQAQAFTVKRTGFKCEVIRRAASR